MFSECFSFKCPHPGTAPGPPLGQVSSWQRVTDSVSVYSSYCDTSPADTKGCPVITALAIAKQDLGAFKCKLWSVWTSVFDSYVFFNCYIICSRYEGSFHAMEGVFSQQPHPTDTFVEVSDYFPVTVACENKFPSKIPYGVTFYKDKGMYVIYVWKCMLVCEYEYKKSYPQYCRITANSSANFRPNKFDSVAIFIVPASSGNKLRCLSIIKLDDDK